MVFLIRCPCLAPRILLRTTSLFQRPAANTTQASCPLNHMPSRQGSGNRTTSTFSNIHFCTLRFIQEHERLKTCTKLYITKVRCGITRGCPSAYAYALPRCAYLPCRRLDRTQRRGTSRSIGNTDQEDIYIGRGDTLLHIVTRCACVV